MYANIVRGSRTWYNLVLAVLAPRTVNIYAKSMQGATFDCTSNRSHYNWLLDVRASKFIYSVMIVTIKLWTYKKYIVIDISGKT